MLGAERVRIGDVTNAKALETPEYLTSADPAEKQAVTGVVNENGVHTFERGGASRMNSLNPMTRNPSLPKAVLARKMIFINLYKKALNPEIQEAILLQIFRVTRDDAMLRRMLDIAEFKPNTTFALFALRLAQSARWVLDKPSFFDFGIGHLLSARLKTSAFSSNYSTDCKPVNASGLSDVCANSMMELKELNESRMNQAYAVGRPSLTSTLVKVADMCCNPDRQESTVIMAALAFPKEWRTVVQGTIFAPHPGEMNGLWQLFRTEFCDVTIQTIGRIDELITELTDESMGLEFKRTIWFSNYHTVHTQVANALRQLKALILHINTLAEKNTRSAIRIHQETRERVRSDVQ